MLEIQLTVPGREAQRRHIERGRYTIGRSLGADIRLRHPSVARRNALISVDDGETLLIDM
jgi:pSer/pThr/pTyr-binding forkhead associated (FHA) protein